MAKPEPEDGTPSPEFLVKSIAEQGYSLETSLADLMDNSISAGADKIEVLVSMAREPFMLFLADNGEGMSEASLRMNMQFPSNSPDHERNKKDLGRFGLGMKTASFSQTRCFTVLSRKKGTTVFRGRTWDVSYLEKHGWKIIVNTEAEIKTLLDQYYKLSEDHLQQMEGFVPSTIVVWSGLYKFENYLGNEDRIQALKREINDVTNEHLSIVFHRFMERVHAPLKIRVNNIILEPFNPFPVNLADFRAIESKQRTLRTDSIKMEGYVLPARSMAESRQGQTPWTTKSRGLMDMEGIYIYRAHRLIRFGDWNGVIKKSPRMQLARLMVEVGNGIDHILHLNVAKSQITIPYELRQAFLRYIAELKEEAEKEYYNTGLRMQPGKRKKNSIDFFVRTPTTKGMVLSLNEDFPLLKSLRGALNREQNTDLSLVFKMVNTSVNKIKQVDDGKAGIMPEGLTDSDLRGMVLRLLSQGIDPGLITESVLPQLGYSLDTLPADIKALLKP